ncbi:SMC-Scp complex subunit ScpB [Roseivivax sp. CAU 1761]
MSDEAFEDEPEDTAGAAARAPRPGGSFPPPPLAEQERMVEALLFAAPEPLSVRALNDRLPVGSDAAEALALLRRRYEGRGVHLMRAGDGWAFRTAPDLGFLMREETVETRKLSRAAIETLAIIAYHQPVTRAEIEEIRGVTVSRGTVDQLMEMEWIRLGRRRMTPGRPVTFVVTDRFLDHFGLESARDLPGLKELRAAGLLESRPPPDMAPRLGEGDADAEEAADTGQSELFED